MIASTATMATCPLGFGLGVAPCRRGRTTKISAVERGRMLVRQRAPRLHHQPSSSPVKLKFNNDGFEKKTPRVTTRKAAATTPSASSSTSSSEASSSSSSRRSAAVIGSGVVGLSVAVRLLEAGFDVTVTSAEQDASELVSHGAGGFWFPYLVEPMERASVWAADTYKEFVRMMEEDAEVGGGVGVDEEEETAVVVVEDEEGGKLGDTNDTTPPPTPHRRRRGVGGFLPDNNGDRVTVATVAGVRMRDVFLYDDLQERPAPPPWAPPDLRELTKDELPTIPSRYAATALGGWKFGAPVIEMPRYLTYLKNRALTLGAKFVTDRLVTASEARPRDADVVVNCAGLGNAAEHDALERDEACYPIRGQIVRCLAPKLQAVYLAELNGGTFSCYAIQRGDVAVLGGTHEEGEWDVTPDETVSGGILERVRAILPEGAMEGVEVMGDWTGLRPGRRGGCRLEMDEEDKDELGRNVVHCYGHGGAGVTCSWGCADEVVSLALRAISHRDKRQDTREGQKESKEKKEIVVDDASSSS